MQYTASVILGNFPESLTDRAAGNDFFEARQVKIVELVLNVSDTRGLAGSKKPYCVVAVGGAHSL